MVLACRPDPALVWLYCLHYAAEGLMIPLLRRKQTTDADGGMAI